jgi:hypothetical protein
MTSIELYPTLDLCIESTAKREFNRLSAEYLAKGGGDITTDKQLMLLRAFLEEADFPALRGASEPHLLEGSKVRFVLTDEGGLSCRMDVL